MAFATCPPPLSFTWFPSSCPQIQNMLRIVTDSNFNCLSILGNKKSISPNMAAAVSPDSTEKKGPGHAETSPSIVSDDSFTNPTGINEKSLLRKLDLRLLPPLTLLYLLSFLDRSNGS